MMWRQIISLSEQRVREEVDLINRRVRAVQKGELPPITCGHCESLVFHYIEYSEDNDMFRVYFKCAGCNSKTFPGIQFMNEIRTELENVAE